jgi:hypothetical protein
MKTLNPSYILIKFIFFILISSSEVNAADAPTCAVLIHPLESKVDQIKGQGGIWGIFDKNYQVRNHAQITLKLDSKITVLIIRLKYLCSTKNGVPLEEIAQILLPQLKAEGEQTVMEYLLNLGHFMEEAKNLIAYARFAESNLNRKLEFDQVSKTVTESQPFANRFVELSEKIGAVEHEKIMLEAKILISEIEKFLETNPYLILADKETAEIPHSRYITGDSDAM